MKIALVCPYDMVQHAGGVQQHVLQLAEKLRHRGHRVKVITPRPRKYYGAPPRNTIFIGRSRRLTRLLATSGDVSLETDGEEIEAILDQEKFDVIHFHEPFVPLIARQILNYSKSAHVGTWHASLYESPGGKSLASIFTSYGRPIAYGMHVITAVSEAAAAVLLDKSNLPITYIPNGINVEHFNKAYGNEKQNNPAKTKTILYLGRLEKRKGLKYLLDAFAQLSLDSTRVKLVIAGSGPDEAKLKEYVSDHRIKNVTFLGYVNETQKLELLHSSDLFCSPARYGESFGIVLLEAMAAGLPLVAGDNQGYRTVLSGRGQLSLVNPVDSVDFARRLELLLTDVKLRDLWLEWAEKYVKQFDFEKVTDQYEKVYEQALQAKTTEA